MTIVCPKCMHKSDDDEHVCEKCGALLVSASGRREVVRAPDDASTHDPSDLIASIRSGESGSAGGARVTQVPIGTDKIATNGDSAEAIRDALEYLESGRDKSKSPRRYPGPTVKPPRRINQGWFVTIGITVLAIIVVILFFTLTGSSNNSGTKAGATQLTNPTLLFEFTGSGPSTTGSFITNSPFNFKYHLSCQPALTTPASFILLKDGTKVAEVTSNTGDTVEKGTASPIGASGTYTISVQAPTSCNWTISGLSS